MLNRCLRPSDNERSDIEANATGFPPSAFTRPLHAIHHTTAKVKAAAAPQEIPPIPSSALITKRSEPPLPKPSPSPSPSPGGESNEKPQHESNGVGAVALMNKYNGIAEDGQQPKAAGNILIQRKRSQSVGASRIPRPASRLGQATIHVIPPVPRAPPIRRADTPSTPTRPTRSMQRSGSAGQVEGPREQNRGRKAVTVAATVLPPGKGKDGGNGANNNNTSLM